MAATRQDRRVDGSVVVENGLVGRVGGSGRSRCDGRRGECASILTLRGMKRRAADLRHEGMETRLGLPCLLRDPSRQK